MLVRLALTAALAALVASGATKEVPEITRHRDVLPILQQNCQRCHRPGEAAPMSLLTYSEVRPWAQAIKEAVLLNGRRCRLR